MHAKQAILHPKPAGGFVRYPSSRQEPWLLSSKLESKDARSSFPSLSLNEIEDAIQLLPCVSSSDNTRQRLPSTTKKRPCKDTL